MCRAIRLVPNMSTGYADVVVPIEIVDAEIWFRFARLPERVLTVRNVELMLDAVRVPVTFELVAEIVEADRLPVTLADPATSRV